MFGWDYDLSHMSFKKVTVEGTEYYKVFIDKDDNVTIVNVDSYNYTDYDDTVILQPLNR